MSSINRCGLVALVGRANVGKSTLLNHLLGEKVTITSRKPQTTQHRILGIHTSQHAQAIYVDTPGMQGQLGNRRAHSMNRVALSSLQEVDVIVLVVSALQWRSDDQWVLERLKKVQKPIVLAINKVDQISDKKQLLPYLNALKDRHSFNAMIPLSALKNIQLERLTSVIAALLPKGDALFPVDQVTDRDDRFLVEELVREKLMRQLGQELPYSLKVRLERYEYIEPVQHIAATIFVTRQSHKAIIIGKKGQRLKQVGQRARLDIERLLGRQVYLQLWVKLGTLDENV